MNEEGDIYRESFHLTLAKSMGFHERKGHKKATFFTSNHAPRAFSMRMGTLGLLSHGPTAFLMRQALLKCA